MSSMRYTIDGPGYPARLGIMPNPPQILTTSGPLEPRRAVAIVGARSAHPESLSFAYDLAHALAKAGIVVISGGARGVDASAHRGALEAGGATWVVAPTGKNQLYPSQHRALFEEVAESENSRMIWSFTDDQGADQHTFRYRNGVLVALCETVVVVQARLASGSRQAMGWAKSFQRTVWAMTALPSMLEFGGSFESIERGLARPLVSMGQLFRSLHLDARGLPAQTRLALPGLDGLSPAKKNGRARNYPGPRKGPPKVPSTDSWTTEEKRIFSEVSGTPTHVDEIAGRTTLPPGSAVTALLTLSLKDVVVEGPDGFFRRRTVT